jgi:hypothetical protein
VAAPAPVPAAAPARLPAWTFALVASAFLASGGAALVYQVAWQRILALQSGVGIYSVAAIVAAFMLGLGAGSYEGGRLSERLSRRGAWRAFALVELAVGLCGAVSVWLYYDVLYVRAAWLYSPLWRAALVHLAVLFPPTFLMGMSLPLLARATVVDTRTAGSWPRRRPTCSRRWRDSSLASGRRASPRRCRRRRRRRARRRRKARPASGCSCTRSPGSARSPSR